MGEGKGRCSGLERRERIRNMQWTFGCKSKFQAEVRCGDAVLRRKNVLMQNVLKVDTIPRSAVDEIPVD